MVNSLRTHSQTLVGQPLNRSSSSDSVWSDAAKKCGEKTFRRAVQETALFVYGTSNTNSSRVCRRVRLTLARSVRNTLTAQMLPRSLSVSWSGRTRPAAHRLEGCIQHRHHRTGLFQGNRVHLSAKASRMPT